MKKIFKNIASSIVTASMVTQTILSPVSTFAKTVSTDTDTNSNDAVEHVLEFVSPRFSEAAQKLIEASNSSTPHYKEEFSSVVDEYNRNNVEKTSNYSAAVKNYNDTFEDFQEYKKSLETLKVRLRLPSPKLLLNLRTNLIRTFRITRTTLSSSISLIRTLMLSNPRLLTSILKLKRVNQKFNALTTKSMSLTRVFKNLKLRITTIATRSRFLLLKQKSMNFNLKLLRTIAILPLNKAVLIP